MTACDRCVFFKPGANDGVRRLRELQNGVIVVEYVGECRAYPPQFVPGHWSGFGDLRSWPIVKRDDWCGSFSEAR